MKQIMLEKNSQGNIRANSFNNLSMVFNSDDVLKQAKISLIRVGDDPVYRNSIQGIPVIVNGKWGVNNNYQEINNKIIVQIQRYIDFNYHYVPSKQTIRDYFELEVD